MKEILRIKSPEEMEAMGARLAHQLNPPCIIFLEGDLGAGKTTLVRGFLRELSYPGTVKSPTYTIVESYEFPQKTIHHFDLYRLRSRDELETMGFADYFDEKTICFIEWPELAEEYLKEPDIYCTITTLGDERDVCIIFR